MKNLATPMVEPCYFFFNGGCYRPCGHSHCPPQHELAIWKQIWAKRNSKKQKYQTGVSNEEMEYFKKKMREYLEQQEEMNMKIRMQSREIERQHDTINAMKCQRSSLIAAQSPVTVNNNYVNVVNVPENGNFRIRTTHTRYLQ
ncbi:predicted protein [Naegleria gruberi]|uniref:Predicted protein n=1 Tax=Naegleria gruberi TaxID=5762 RepID=D2VDC6_NAEGR|nr:uncharacterized protein NAEGRDRAFT_66796 [Naegleria gruberi]EFC45121.1 predicted protein [Naegleria gruberi]|eukprot:XP_002677865.1 predicted protein [Naegleria gruberi strain NEG-M]